MSILDQMEFPVADYPTLLQLGHNSEAVFHGAE